MADIGKKVRELMLQGVKAVNNAANSVASTTRYKVDELNLQNRRKELLGTVSELAYALYKRGEELPEGLASVLKNVARIDEELSAIREERRIDAEKAKSEKAAKAAQVKKDESPADPVLSVPEKGPYAEAAEKQQEKETTSEEVEEQIEDCVEDIKRAVSETMDALEDAVEAFADKPEEKE